MREDSELRRLELAHHELCTALTSLRSNVELVRLELRANGTPSAVRDHLGEVEVAVQRLERLARAFRTWHAA